MANRRREDHQVETERPVVDVVEVEPSIGAEVRIVACLHLPQTGHTGWHAQSVEQSVVELRHLVGQRRPRPHEAHLAAQHVPQLRQLVERRGAKHTSDARHTRVVLELEQWPGPLVRSPQHRQLGFGLDTHGAELDHVERAAVATHAALPEQHRAPVVEDDRRSDQDGEGRSEGEHRKRAEEVEQPLGHHTGTGHRPPAAKRRHAEAGHGDGAQATRAEARQATDDVDPHTGCRHLGDHGRGLVRGQRAWHHHDRVDPGGGQHGGQFIDRAHVAPCQAVVDRRLPVTHHTEHSAPGLGVLVEGGHDLGRRGRGAHHHDRTARTRSSGGYRELGHSARPHGPHRREHGPPGSAAHRPGLHGRTAGSVPTTGAPTGPLHPVRSRGGRGRPARPVGPR